MEGGPERIFFSFGRLWTIGRNTITEVVRQKFFYILVFFGMIVLLLSHYLSQFDTFQIDRTKFIKDFGLAAIKIFGTLIAIVSTAQLLPMELENRTIYPILAKPVFRGEFLLGKYVGMISLLLLTTFLMGLIFGGVLFYTEHEMTSAALRGENLQSGVTSHETVLQILKQTRDPAILKAVVLIFIQLVMISSISLLIATFATSVVFNVIVTVMIYICGHLEGIARQSVLEAPTVLDTGQAFISKSMLLIITFLVPDLNVFDVVDQVINGQVISLSYLWKAIGYGIFYSGGVLLLAYLIFEDKEI